jgi:predicted acylesterase/phospholipase RssA
MTPDSPDAVNQPGSSTKTTLVERFENCANPLCRCLVKVKGEYCDEKSCGKQIDEAEKLKEKHIKNSEIQKYCSCGHIACHLECDLVMKGGITSGIIYPPLVLTLKGNYHFRSVGGTSAGAIAAAATAAAEFGREKGGFKKLEELNRDLGKDTFLRDLFQPSHATSPLMEVIFAITDSQGKQAKGTRPKRHLLNNLLKIVPAVDAKLDRPNSPYAKGTGMGFIYGFVLALSISSLALAVLLLRSLLTGEASYWWLSFVPLLALLGPFGTIGSKLGGLVSSAVDLYAILMRRVPENLFGICTGLADESAQPNAKAALTGWLHERLDDMAFVKGRKLDEHSNILKPLTFGDLRLKELDDQLVCAYPREDNITLRMVTCNLSQNQPYIIPFKDHLFIYKEVEFRKLFPKEVVEYMIAKPASRLPYTLPPGHYFLPEPDDLPVIIATRMSLSFPLLLSAVPLYTIKPNKIVTDNKKQVTLDETDLQINWFSDGGIASNFPIHFFDSWLPTRPTFGVNLTSLPKEGFTVGTSKRTLTNEYTSVVAKPTSEQCAEVTGETASESIDSDLIYLPAANALPATEWIPLSDKSPTNDQEIPSLLKFLWSIFTTAQNYRDNSQAMLPSYRERVVQIRLSEDEGGLNLAMPEPTIQRVMKKGESAGKVLLNNFNFEVHQWVRLRVLMKQMEASLKKIRKVTAEKFRDEMPPKFNYDLLLARQLAENFPYKCDDPWNARALARLSEVNELMSKWTDSDLFAQEPHPLPEPVLRVTPEL